jgi:hypothetical protein
MSWCHNPLTPKWLPWDIDRVTTQRQAEMKKNTSTKSVWSIGDLHRHALMKQKQPTPSRRDSTGCYTSPDEPRSHPQDPDCEGPSHDHPSQAPLRRGYREGKAIIPAKTVLQQIGDILKTPAILAGAISRSAAMRNLGPQVTEEEKQERATQAVPPRKKNATQATPPKATAPSPSSYHTYVRRWQSAQ